MEKTVEIPIRGMDCDECTRHVQHAIESIPGVRSVDVFLVSEKAVVQLDSERVELPAIHKAVAGAGYTVPETGNIEEIALDGKDSQAQRSLAERGVEFTRQALLLFAVLFGLVLFVVVAGEWLGLFEAVTARIPWPLSLAVILAGGYPVFLNVIRAAFKGQVISHTLMTLGVLAAVAVGQWATAAVVVLFMRAGDYAERITTERARRAVKDLTAMAPQTARVERSGEECEIPAGQVQPGEVVIVRPGEKIPVDGVVIGGQATIDQASITGEAMPVEAGPGSHVFAATLTRIGSLRVKVEGVGPDTTFGRVIRLVEEAEANRAGVQRVADRFSAWYLPVVAGIAGLTFLLRRDPLATAAVLVVACSCSFALATPIAMLASIGAAARRGLLIKGGKYIEALSQVDTLLIDKTGTLTMGRPQITEVVVAGMFTEAELLRLAASAERYSEHPLAEAVRQAAKQAGASLLEPQEVEMLPGLGALARIGESRVAVGSMGLAQVVLTHAIPENISEQAAVLESRGKTIIYVIQDGALAGLLAAEDTLRHEVPGALLALQALGISRIELLTGDREAPALALVGALEKAAGGKLNLSCRVELLPEEKIGIVRDHQAGGRRVMMVGDGVNDAPALAQADVGIAMGAAGADIAIEAAHLALMRDDWLLVPQAVQIARRTMRVVKMNIAFTAVYNLLGLSLAAFGFLPPILAAAAQSLPDLGILANSSRLLRQKQDNV